MFREKFINELFIINSAYQRAIGTGLYLGLYLLAILYVFVKYKEEDKNTRNLFLIYPIIVFIVIWNPLFANIIMKFIGEAVYWRVYWLLPIGITLAYLFTKWIFLDTNKYKRVATLALTIFVIMMSGKFIYTEEYFSKVNNFLKIPDDVLDIIYSISEDEENYKKLAAPHEFVVYTRQVDGTIKLENGRNMTAEYSDDSIVTQIDNGNTAEIGSIAKSHDCNYVILKNNVEYNGDLENYGFKLLKKNAQYSLYKFE